MSRPCPYNHVFLVTFLTFVLADEGYQAETS